jgi:hypothetical protein
MAINQQQQQQQQQQQDLSGGFGGQPTSDDTEFNIYLEGSRVYINGYVEINQSGDYITKLPEKYRPAKDEYLKFISEYGNDDYKFAIIKTDGSFIVKDTGRIDGSYLSKNVNI